MLVVLVAQIGNIPHLLSQAKDQQDYDLQTIIETASQSGTDDAGAPVPYVGKVDDNQRVVITKVFYRSPRAMWRFYGYYGGVGVVGNYVNIWSVCR